MTDIALALASVVLIGAIAFVVGRALLARVVVAEYQQGVEYRNGRLSRVLTPGGYWIVRPTTAVRLVDLRKSVVAIPGQEIVTSDGISVKISLAVTLEIADPVKALHAVDNYLGATYSMIQVALREIVGGMPIDEILAGRGSVGPEVLRRSADAARALGVEIVNVDIRDLMFPGAMKKVFSQVVEARQQGLASLEKARGETAALRNLANAARLVEANPSLLQLRMLQQLESSSGNTVVLGLPSNSTPLPVRAREAGSEGPQALEEGRASGSSED